MIVKLWGWNQKNQHTFFVVKPHSDFLEQIQINIIKNNSTYTENLEKIMFHRKSACSWDPSAQFLFNLEGLETYKLCPRPCIV